MAGKQKDLCIGAASGRQSSLPRRGGTRGCILQRAHYGCADRKYGAGIRFRLANFVGHFGRNFVGLGVNFVFLERFGVHGLERAEAHVQGDFTKFAAPCFQLP